MTKDFDNPRPPHLQFRPGDIVEKITGDYRAIGEVRDVFQPDPVNNPDMWRVSVSITQITKGVLIHIMSPQQIKKVEPKT